MSLTVADVTLRGRLPGLARSSNPALEIERVHLIDGSGSLHWAPMSDLRAAGVAELIRAAESMARRQIDRELAEERELERRVEADAAPVVRYGLDSTGVRWIVWVETSRGESIGRTWRGTRIVAADEGGTLYTRSSARAEADDIAERILRRTGIRAKVAEAAA